MPSDNFRAIFDTAIKENDAKIAECERNGFNEGSQIATLVEHLKHQNAVFRKALGLEA